MNQANARRPWMLWPLTLTSALIALLFVLLLVVNMIAIVSPEDALAVVGWPMGETLLHLAAGIPRWLLVLMIAWMFTVTALGPRAKPLGSAALGMGLVWDVGSAVVSLLAALTSLEDFALLARVISLPVALGVALAALARLALTVMALRHPFYRVKEEA